MILRLGADGGQDNAAAFVERHPLSSGRLGLCSSQTMAPYFHSSRKKICGNLRNLRMNSRLLVKRIIPRAAHCALTRARLWPMILLPD
jgi:hypothetical protein